MSLLSNRFPLLCLFFVALFVEADAQQLSIQLGGTEVALNQAFTIKASAVNTNLTSCQGFPDLKGFQKGGTSRSSFANIVNGKITKSESIIQNYIPTREGTFKIPPFSMQINGKEVKSEGGVVKVGPAQQQQQQQRRSIFDPFAGIWGYNRPAEVTEDLPSVKGRGEGAFLSVSINKGEVYVGEGFNVTVTFYKPYTQRDKYAFDASISEQVVAIQKELKPSSCWEENTPITRLNDERVNINGQLYIGYKLYQTTFFPFSTGDIELPSVSLNMKEYTLTNRRTLFGRQIKEGMKAFYSLPKKIEVKALPDHPLREKVNVGVYELQEDIDREVFKTGDAFSYKFAVRGRGNISSIGEPRRSDTDSLTVFGSNTQQQVNKSKGVVYGAKQFEYFIQPLEAGSYDLGNYFEWIYFNTEKQAYDTLRPRKVIQVTGPSKRNQKVSAADLGSYYNDMARFDNSLRPLSGGVGLKWLGNILLGLSMVGGAALIWKHKKKEE